MKSLDYYELSPYLLAKMPAGLQAHLRDNLELLAGISFRGEQGYIHGLRTYFIDHARWARVEAMNHEGDLREWLLLYARTYEAHTLRVWGAYRPEPRTVAGRIAWRAYKKLVRATEDDGVAHECYHLIRREIERRELRQAAEKSGQ